MPRLAISLPKTYPNTSHNIQMALDAGITHFVTANDYLNQAAVGKGLAGLPRSSYFITTMTSPCQCAQTEPHCHRNITDLKVCEATTKQEVMDDLAKLNLSYVDLILLHGPNEVVCSGMGLISFSSKFFFFATKFLRRSITCFFIIMAGCRS